MPKLITPDVVKQITKNLVEFGYEGLTEESVQAEVDKFLAGEKATGIIGMMTRDMLTKNGYA
tara:strand:- start:194 stop:379 length:186 start_codon:yes stop_codon:yes gene_type:complete